jgi:hypothetical protein
MFTNYRPSHGYDEYFSAADQPRAALSPLLSSLGRMGIDQLNSNHAAAADSTLLVVAVVRWPVALQSVVV